MGILREYVRKINRDHAEILWSSIWHDTIDGIDWAENIRSGGVFPQAEQL